MLPYRMPRIPPARFERTKCPPEGAIGQALPRGKPFNLVITANPETGNPLALEVRNQRAKEHKQIPIRCQPWLGAGTVVSGTVVSRGKNVWYVLHDVHQLSGRSLREASHRERLGALVGLMRDIDIEGMQKLGWPSFALATMLPAADGRTEFPAPSAKEIGYPVRQVQCKVLGDKGTVYVFGDDTKPKQTEARFVMMTKRTGSSNSDEVSSPGSSCCEESSTGSGSGSGSDSEASSVPFQKKRVNIAAQKSKAMKQTRQGPTAQCETVMVMAGSAGPDDYHAVDKHGKRSAPLHVSSIELSLKLNQLLRGKHYELYRPPGSVRVLREMSLPCVWENKHQRWRPVIDTGTKAKTTYPVRTS